MAQFINHNNNGAQPKRAPSTVISVGDFMVPTGMGSYIPYSASVTLLGTASGTFVLGESVSQATSGATGVVLAVTTAGITVGTVSGTFDTTHVVTGGTSSATMTPSSVVTNNKIFGVSNQAVASTDSDYATSGVALNMSTSVKVQDYLNIPVSAGTATTLLEGTYVDVDPAHPGSVTVSAAGTQIYVYQVIDASNIIGFISLSV